MSNLISIQTKVIVALEDHELQDMLASNMYWTGLGDESVDHLLKEGDLVEARTVGSRVHLTFIGTKRFEDTPDE